VSGEALAMDAGVFTGWLRHRRFTPVPHEFSYPIFMVLLDVDRLEPLMRVSRFTSYNRWNWAAFDERDYFGDPRVPLRERLEQDARRAGCDLPDGRILLLTHLRYLGYCFNPVSFFYCLDRGGQIQLILAAVSNTFGGRHNYWLRPDEATAGESGAFCAAAAKSLDVSPFLERDLDYTFALTPPADRAVAHIRTLKRGRLVLDATLALDRRPWSAKEVRRVLIRHPAMTLSVVARIHWQALRLWSKGVPAYERSTR
jgi:DUF1365 family protein